MQRRLYLAKRVFPKEQYRREPDSLLRKNSQAHKRIETGQNVSQIRCFWKGT